MALVLLLALAVGSGGAHGRGGRPPRTATTLQSPARGRGRRGDGGGDRSCGCERRRRGQPARQLARGRRERARLSSLDSMRYEYWRVALDTFADHPLVGTGSGGFRVEWLRERPEKDASGEAHSLYLETLAELGLAGAAALLVMLVGLGLSARRALRRAARRAGPGRAARDLPRPRRARLGLGDAGGNAPRSGRRGRHRGRRRSRGAYWRARAVRRASGFSRST